MRRRGMAAKSASEVDESVIHALVQRLFPKERVKVQGKTASFCWNSLLSG